MTEEVAKSSLKRERPGRPILNPLSARDNKCTVPELEWCLFSLQIRRVTPLDYLIVDDWSVIHKVTSGVDYLCHFIQ